MPVIEIDAISLPAEAHAELEKRLANRAGTAEHSPGFVRFQLLRAVAGDDRYFVLTEWESEDDFVAWRDRDARAAHDAPRGPTPATGIDLGEFEVVRGVNRPA